MENGDLRSPRFEPPTGGPVCSSGHVLRPVGCSVQTKKEEKEVSECDLLESKKILTIKSGWLKLKMTQGVLCAKIMQIKFKAKTMR